MLGEPLADAETFASQVQAVRGRQTGSGGGDKPESMSSAEELREWTEMLGGEGSAGHGLNTSYGNHYVVVATRDDRRYS